MAEVTLHRNTDGDLEPVIYPVIELWLTYYNAGKLIERDIPSCRFHALWGVSDEELAGMGLAIIGNLVQVLGKDLYEETLEAKLLFKRHSIDKGVELPWPGMPNDDPVPLDLMQMPFDTAMFFNHEGNGQKRLDRWALMARIQHIWVPFLKQQLQRSMV